MPRLPSTASLVASDRSHPEDAVRVVVTDTLAAFAVADGAGGLGGGARAAQLVVESFAHLVSNASPAALTPERWCTLLQQIDEQVLRDPDAGESTAVVAALHGDRVVGASVGDSEAWVVTSDGYIALTAGQHRPRLGSGRAIPVGFEGSVANAALIAATDGLFHAASPAAICDVLRTDPRPQPLVALARSPSGKLYDDVGIVIVSLGPPLR